MVLQVGWTDQYSTLLTLDEKRIIDDERMVLDRPHTKDWNLLLHDVKYDDRGRYTCQINTMPIKTKTIELIVLGMLQSFIYLFCISFSLPCDVMSILGSLDRSVVHIADVWESSNHQRCPNNDRKAPYERLEFTYS